MLKKWCQPSHISTELSYTISSFLLSMTFLWLLRSLQLSSNFILLLTLILFLFTTPVSIVFSLSFHFHVSPISSYHLQCHHPLTILSYPLLNHFFVSKTLILSGDTVFQHHSTPHSPSHLQPSPFMFPLIVIPAEVQLRIVLLLEDDVRKRPLGEKRNG